MKSGNQQSNITETFVSQISAKSLNLSLFIWEVMKLIQVSSLL